MNRNEWRLLTAAVLVVIGIIAMFAMFDVVPVTGSEVGVKEGYFTGVAKEPMPGGYTYFAWPWERITKYSIGIRKFAMSDTPSADAAQQKPAYKIESKDNQEMHVSFQVRWSIDPSHIVNLHKTVEAGNFEEKMLWPEVLKLVKNQATTREAIVAYSGEGLVQLESDITKDLQNPANQLGLHGIIVNSFNIEHVRLDPNYVAEITARQIAIQKESRAVQEEKAAQAIALKVKAEAQSALNAAVVKAEQDKQVAILAAEGENQRSVLASEAEKKKAVLAAEAIAESTLLQAKAEEESGKMKASAIMAIGVAQAEAEKLKYSAYAAPGAETFARIEISKSAAQAFSGIRGYLPEGMNVGVLGNTFTSAIDGFMEPRMTTAKSPTAPPQQQ